jgi:DNA repair exonuclease SbcCD ATPase subunit
MNIRLNKLTLEHFKGADKLELTFDGRNASIYGNNAAGKTTIHDAWLWLLTGKDSTGSADFSIKPVDSSGAIIDHAAHSAVEAVINASGQEITLRREYFEKWSKKRGSAEATYDGNTTEYYINGVPKSKTDYESALEKLVDLDTLRLISDPAAFAALNWKKRREILFSIADVGDDFSLMAGAPKYNLLAEAAAPIGLDDLRAQLKAQRKKINQRLNALPLLIGENQTIAEEMKGINFDALRAQLAELEEKEHALTTALAEAAQGDTGSLKNAVTEAQFALRELEQENREYRAAQERKLPIDRRPELERRKLDLQAEIRRTRKSFATDTDTYHAAVEKARKMAEESEAYKAEWRQIKQDAFTGASCPYCGQPMSGEHLEQAKRKWEQDKDRELTRVTNAGKRAKQDMEDAQKAADAVQDRLAAREARLADIAGQLSRLEEELASLPAVDTPEIQSLPHYVERYEKLTKQLTTAQATLEAAQKDAQSATDDLRSQRFAIRDEMQAKREQLAKESTLKSVLTRIKELEDERQQLAEELASVEHLTDLAEDFIRYKVERITDSINSLFRLAQFRLFTEQVNGGIADSCDILCGGVPYDSGLNNGARINVGLDIINTLSREYGSRVPVFVDNAESVVELEGMDTQVIRLVVSADDDEIRMVKE